MPWPGCARPTVSATSRTHSHPGGPGRRCGLQPASGVGVPDTVYETYGKFYVFALIAVLACAIAVRSRRGTAGMGLTERWGWRISLPSYVLLATSLFITYWVANLDVVFLLVTVPTMLLNTIGELLLGIGLIGGKFRPRLTGWLLAMGFPLSQGLIAISTQALGMWPTMFAWGLAGWSLWRSSPRQSVQVPRATLAA